MTTNTRRTMITAGIGLAAATAFGLHSATAATAPTSAADHDTIISFTEDESSDQTFNLGAGHGVAVGQIELSGNHLIQRGHVIGHDGADCTITRLGGGTADSLCTITFVLRRGQLTATGLVTSTPNGPGTFDIGIAGGTGAYQDARGYASIDANTQRTTLHIRAHG